ncbi:hypothetical protein DEI97_009940 [Curtobacterium sp. MCLR17_032]|uniref:hypothetical protein n=1 Tax=Curtobacterium sp. MCLR17_032 TaxID=2175650 RepID=UPI000DA982AC|nr:hypothetical protein [Curtobacterium sp. MCLR17_032]WIE60098.1 hypothetical protein DEI97_009940 [Curtobacterium sp. MCLR17_032]
MTSRSLRAISIAALVVPAALVLAGCSGGGSDRATASATATAGVVGRPVSQTCAELVPTDTFSVYGQQFERVRAPKPTKGSPVAQIAAQDGRVCTWRSTADDDVTVTVAVAHLPGKQLTQLKDALFEQGGSVPTYTVEGYFTLSGKTGRADAFADPYWIHTSSTLFTEPGAAQPVVDAVRAAVAPDARAPESSAPTP